jgi:hypothetical protein
MTVDDGLHSLCMGIGNDDLAMVSSALQCDGCYKVMVHSCYLLPLFFGILRWHISYKSRSGRVSTQQSPT